MSPEEVSDSRPTLIGGAQAAAISESKYRTWMAYVSRGQAPQPVMHVGRTPLWDEAEVKEWQAQRPRRPRRDPNDPPPLCKEGGCDQKAVSRDLCFKHYKRAYVSPHAGVEPRQGQVAVLGDGRLVCAECGEGFWSLGGHLKAHDMTADEYRDTHDLARGVSLVADKVRERQSDQAKARVGTEGWARFERARDPQRAAATRDAQTFKEAARTKRGR